MRVIVGLGNPGKKYQKTRHNVGFLAAERVASAWGIPIQKKKWGSLMGQGVWEGEEILLAQPQTYMNCSGEAVGQLLSETRIALAELLVVCDDLALPIGYARLRAQGSAGGHQGLASIIKELQTERFTRLRIGIGEPVKGLDPIEYVLSPFSKGEWEIVESVLDRIPNVCQIWIQQGIQKAMSSINEKVKVKG